MGAPHYTVALQKIAAEQGLTVLHAAQDYATREIRTADVNRPGLQLAGFYNYFDPERLQIIGRVESTYLETLTPDQRRERFAQFMRYNIIGLVICHGMDPFPECLEMAEKYDRNLFLVRKDTSEFMADLIAALSSYLAPRLTQHGVLVEVFGEGVLITGDSGVGTSETALELIMRGHRLTITPHGILAQVEGPHQAILRHFPALRQLRLHLGGDVVEVGQPQKHLLDGGDGEKVFGQVGVEGGWFGCGAEAQRHASFGRGRGRLPRRRRHRRGAGDEQHEHGDNRAEPYELVSLHFECLLCVCVRKVGRSSGDEWMDYSAHDAEMTIVRCMTLSLWCVQSSL